MPSKPGGQSHVQPHLLKSDEVDALTPRRLVTCLQRNLDVRVPMPRELMWAASKKLLSAQPRVVRLRWRD